MLLGMVVESALPYSVKGFAFLLSYGLGSDVAILFGALYGMECSGRVGSEHLEMLKPC